MENVLKKFRALIADDEPLGRQGIVTLLQTDADIEIVATCADGRGAKDAIYSLRPDIAFLDVQMPLVSGIALLAQIPAEERPASVIVTAYDSYAIPAFDVCAVDYLVKPFREARFREALKKAKAAASLKRTAAATPLSSPPADPPAAPPRPARIAFKAGRGHLLVDPDEILWVEAAGDGVKICEGREVHPVRESLQQVERRLGAGRLLRVHRSFLVNPSRVRRIAPLLYGEHELLMSDGVRIRVGRAFRDQLKILLPGAAKR